MDQASCKWGLYNSSRKVPQSVAMKRLARHLLYNSIDGKEVFSMTKNDEREVQRKLRMLQHAERIGKGLANRVHRLDYGFFAPVKLLEFSKEKDLPKADMM